MENSTEIPGISPPLSLKSPCQPFDNNKQAAPLVFFLHPGYAENHNILLTLPALDSGGIHHGTAYIACAILANCRWDGFLSLRRDGPRLSTDLDDVLPHSTYYFRIEDQEQYPVVPTFDHFRCPTSLPPPFSSAPVLPSSADDVIRRDVSCRITATALPNEAAHIIPAAQSDWWQRNSMFLYQVNPDRGVDTRCADNTILLRRDLRKMWDDNKFAIVPKAGKWVVHVLWNSSMVEIQERYHNLELQPLAGVSRHFFLCRFALAVFSKSLFLGQRVQRKLAFIDGEDVTKLQVRNMTADEYQRKFSTASRANSRSQSPKKRQRSVPGNGDDDGSEPEESEYNGNQDEEEEEEERGRTRKRRWSIEASDSLVFFNEIKDGTAGALHDSQSSQSAGPCRKRRRSSADVHLLRTPPRSTSPTGL